MKLMAKLLDTLFVLRVKPKQRFIILFITILIGAVIWGFIELFLFITGHQPLLYFMIGWSISSLTYTILALISSFAMKGKY